jgi:hypothetical protein
LVFIWEKKKSEVRFPIFKKSPRISAEFVTPSDQRNPMSWMTTGIIIIFAAFIILLLINPKLSCFGKQITSPLYPLKRKRKQRQRQVKTDDYGFRLGDTDTGSSGMKRKSEDEESFLDQFKHKKSKAKDYGFHLTDENETQDKDAQGEQNNRNKG